MSFLGHKTSPLLFPSASHGLSQFLLNTGKREEQRHTFNLPRMPTPPCWGVFPALSTSWEQQQSVGKMFPSPVTAPELRGHQNRPLCSAPRALCISAAVFLDAHFCFCPWMVWALRFPCPLPAALQDCCRLSHLLWLQVMVRSHRKGRLHRPLHTADTSTLLLAAAETWANTQAFEMLHSVCSPGRAVF